ncbi:hypothetical protein D5086_001464 [Populus alba]|uniref:Uncharacterized protein n=1 Tax=Populus alba TaxID=43335 RepID=A0ACC4CZG8_POPAL
MIQEDHGSLTEISDSGKHISFSHKNKSLSLALFVSLLLVATIAAVVTPVNSQNSNKNGAAHSIIKMSCSSTRYPELCYSAIANGPGAAASLAAINDENDVLIQSIKATQQAIDTNTADIESYKTTNKMTLTNQQTDALDASTDNNELSQSDLQNAENSLLYYTNEIPLSDQDDGPDINTPLSSCITYQDTIMDGFSHTAADKEVRKDISDGVDNVRKMCMNYSGNEHEHDSHSHCNELKTTKRNLKEENSRNESGWPKWLSVSQQEVVAVIIIDTRCGGGCWMAAGIIVQYQLQLLLPQREAVGGKTIITASRSVVDGITAFRSATVDEVEQQAFRRKTRKRLIIVVVSSVVLLAAIIGAVIGVVVHNRNNNSSSNPVPPPELTPAASLKAVCSVTRYPTSCFSSISALETGKLRTQRCFSSSLYMLLLMSSPSSKTTQISSYRALMTLPFKML